MSKLTRHDIITLFEKLDVRLEQQSTRGELYIVGGAVMCLVHDARESTMDVDGLFKPAKELRNLAVRLVLNLDLMRTG